MSTTLSPHPPSDDNPPDQELVQNQQQKEQEVFKEPFLTKGQWVGIGIVASVVSVAVICLVALICGEPGNCGRAEGGSSSLQLSPRANFTLSFINSITLTGQTLRYPSTGVAEERALKWLIDDDLITNVTDLKALRQRYALATLWFQADTGGPWDLDPLPVNKWATPSLNECDWSNIDCSVNGNVTSIDLSSAAVTGQIPSDFGLLTDLTLLDLSYNQLTSNIPSSFGEQLTALEHLNLDSNQLKGVIPSSLGKLTALTLLRLQNNGLTGTMPFCGSDKNASRFKVLEADCNEVACPCCTNDCTPSN